MSEYIVINKMKTMTKVGGAGDRSADLSCMDYALQVTHTKSTRHTTQLLKCVKQYCIVPG